MRDGDDLRRALRQQSEYTGRRLRRLGLRGKTVAIKLRWADFTTLTRQMTLQQPVNDDQSIYEAALTLFQNAWSRSRPVRLVGVGVSGFEEGSGSRQLTLWEAEETQSGAKTSPQLQSTLD